MKRVINLNIDINEVERVAISSLSVLDNRFIINFKLNAFKAAVFGGVLFEIGMKLNKSSISFSIIVYVF